MTSGSYRLRWNSRISGNNRSKLERVNFTRARLVPVRTLALRVTMLREVALLLHPVCPIQIVFFFGIGICFLSFWCNRCRNLALGSYFNTQSLLTVKISFIFLLYCHDYSYHTVEDEIHPIPFSTSVYSKSMYSFLFCFK